MSTPAVAEQAHQHEREDAVQQPADEREERASGDGTWEAAKLRAVEDEVGGGEQDHKHMEQGKSPAKDKSARFENDPNVEEVTAGTKTWESGDAGGAVTKLQSALIDLGYLLPKHGVDGDFGSETRKAVEKFQGDVPIPVTGEFDKATIDALHAKFDTRQPYIDNATRDPAHPGLRTLESYEKDQALAAMVPTGGAAVAFVEEIAGVKYGDKIKTRLTSKVASLHTDLFTSKEPLRADPAKNFHADADLEGAAKAGQLKTDALYGSYAAPKEMTFAKGSLVDMWADEEAFTTGMLPADKKDKAENMVRYLIDANCADINSDHHANTGGALELAILDPIVDSFIDTAAKVDKMIEIERGWEGAQGDGKVFLQRYKQGTDDANRIQLWDLFHTCIHEYLHLQKHPDFDAFARGLGGAREHTLLEGFCDFFTLNVRATLTIDAGLQQAVEGSFFDPKVPPPANADGKSSGVYDSHEQAEQVVATVGIRNAQEAYFKGDVKRIGAP